MPPAGLSFERLPNEGGVAYVAACAPGWRWLAALDYLFFSAFRKLNDIT
jgi:hypothetical protein